MVLCKACDRYLALLRDDGQHHDQLGHDMVMLILDFCKEPKSVPEIMDNAGLSYEVPLNADKHDLWLI